MTNERTALVLGATGGIGGEVALALLQRGWRVRSLHRDPERAARSAPHLTQVQWIAGDAMRREDVVAAATVPMSSCMASTRPVTATGAASPCPCSRVRSRRPRRPGPVWCFPARSTTSDPMPFPTYERSPQNPLTRKGRIRVEMEKRLEAASRDGVRTLIVRAGDYFGPRTGNSWFAQGLIKPGQPVRQSSIRAGRTSATPGPTFPTLPPPSCNCSSGRGACRVRRVPLRRPLVRGGHPNGPCHPARRWRAQASHPPVSLGPGLRPQSVRHRLPGNVGASIFMATPCQARQCQARGIPRRRAAHPDRCGRAQHA